MRAGNSSSKRGSTSLDIHELAPSPPLPLRSIDHRNCSKSSWYFSASFRNLSEGWAQYSVISARFLLDMFTRGYFDHINPDGEEPCARIDAAGYLSVRPVGALQVQRAGGRQLDVRAGARGQRRPCFERLILGAAQPQWTFATVQCDFVGRDSQYAA